MNRVRSEGATQVRRGPFWARSATRRPAAFVSLLILSMIAVAVSVLAPTLLRAVEQQTLADAVAAAGPARTSIVASADQQPGILSSGIAIAVDLVTRASSKRWTPAVTSVESDDAFTWTSLPSGAAPPPGETSRPQTPLVGVGSTCASTPLLSGRCPTRTGEVAVSRQTTLTVSTGSSSAAPALTVGSRIVVTVDDKAVPLTVVGVYDDRSFASRIVADPVSLTGSRGPSGEAALVIALKQFEGLNVSGSAHALITLRHAVHLDDVEPLRRDVAHVKEGLQQVESATTDGGASTGLIAILDRIAPQHDAAQVILATVTIAAVVLAWFTVALAVQQIGRVRSAEWGLARLRGLPRRRWLGTVFLEPGIALIVGAVLGYGLGALLAVVSSAALVGPSAPVEPGRPLVFGTAAVALAGSLLALASASVRSARLPLAALLRETTEPRQISRPALIGQTAVVIVAALAIYTLFGQKHIAGAQLPLALPTLVPIVVGILAVTVAIRVIRLGSRGRPRSLGGIIIGRRLGRTPSILTAAVMVSLGLATLTFSTQTAVVALRLQDQRAAAATGASTVLRVEAPPDVSLLKAVRQADPSGREALAAVVSTTGNGAGRFVAVDTSRLAAVSSWQSAWAGVDAASLHSRLAPPTGPSFDLRGTSLALTVSGTRVTKGAEPLSNLQLIVVVQADDGWHSVVLGEPRDGVLRSPAGSFPCSSGCRVAWMGVQSSLATAPPFGVEMAITGFSTDRQPSASLAGWLDPGRWRNRIGERTDPQNQAQAVFADTSGTPRLDVTFTDPSGSATVSAAPRDAPEPLPAVVAGSTDVPAFPGVDDAVQGVAPDLTPLLLTVVARGSALPRVLGEGVMVDLELADRVSDGGSHVGYDEVWLAPGSHPTVLARLKAEGLQITGTKTLADVTAADEREAPPRAALSGIPVGAAGFLLAVTALIALRVIGSRGRRPEWRSLIAAGVPVHRLRKLIFWETLVPSAAGTVLGVASGLAALWLTVGRLPLLSGAGATPPADLVPALLPLGVTLVGTLLLLVGIAAAGARLELAHHERTGP